MTDAMKAVIDRIMADKRTTWIGCLCLGLIGAGNALSSYAIEPWGTAVTGLGGMLAGGTILFTQFVKPEAPAPVVQLQPPAQPPQQPPPGAP